MNEQTKVVAIATIEPQAPAMLALIDRAARDPSIDVEKMERLLALASQIHERESKSAYDTALTAAQGEMRPISRDCHNPQTRSRYASYEAIDNAIRPIYTAHGFAMSFGCKAASAVDHVVVTCRVSHRSGHTEYVELDMPADGKGARGSDLMTKTHATGSALSYAKRYIANLVWNLSFGESDDDGNAAGRAPKHQAVYTPPTEPKQATPAIRLRMLENLKQFSRDDLVNFMSARLWNVVSPEEWPLEHVPTTREKLGELIREIEQFIERNAPKETGEFSEPFWNQIITVPRAGTKRAEYLKNPDTILSLYQAAKSGDQKAGNRLWGIANEWTPQEYQGNPPSVEDKACRNNLDSFLRWHDAKEKTKSQSEPEVEVKQEELKDLIP